MNQIVLTNDLRREFSRLKDQVGRALQQISDEQFFHCLDEESNSIAIMIKHLAGNMRSRFRDFLTTDGEKSDRRRDQEFMILNEENRTAITQQLAAGWATLFEALTPLQDADLQKTVFVRGEPLTVFQALIRQLAHYSYHVGQIIFMAKHLRGEHWQTLSIPKGKSEEFNRNPQQYMKKPK